MSYDKESIEIRIIIICAALWAVLALIAARAAYLQVYQGDWLSGKAEGQYKRLMKSSGKRGTIYDRKHRKLAVTIEVNSIAAYPYLIEDPAKTSEKLAKIFDTDKKSLIKKLSSEKSFVWIKRQVTPAELAEVKKLSLSGIDFIPEYNRFYPHRELAAQVIGFCGVDGRGLEGLEFYYEKYLKGKEKTVTVLKDALGRGFEREEAVLADSSGSDLIITLDMGIQIIVEKAIQEAVDKFSAKSAMGIVMDPKTGEILALAHYPGFNPNSFRSSNKTLWRNRAITDPFEPGSVMKIFSAAAAVESGIYNADSLFFCENGKYKIGRNVVHDTKKHGWLSLQQIVKYSSNIGVVKIVEHIGPKLLYDTLTKFGFGEKSMIDSPGESPGKLSNYEQWADIDAGAIAFGHGMLASVLQINAGACAIANSGFLMKPYIVKAVMEPSGKFVKSFGPKVVRRAVSEKTAKTVSWIMGTVTTEGGTGINAAIRGYISGGKTGTAQKLEDNGRYSDGKYIASFIGFAPLNDPKLVIYIAVDEPQGLNYYGGSVAAPAFKTIAEETLIYMDVPPINEPDAVFLKKPKVIESIKNLSITR